MNFIEFIFAIVMKFVPVDRTRLAQLEQEGKTWYAQNVVNADKEGGQPKNKVVAELGKHGETWYFQTFLAVFWIFAVKWIHNFINSDEEEDE